ncbi:exonuclease domain-containing protein [Frankia sp. R43]|uniref:exonuclease domain-containing protein n=1 Tax=Frankia sp. R43 TaxID=269536 RepID=UPI000B2B9E31|nr:exonuclease domain-containing protein [Frankia sp. R43]
MTPDLPAPWLARFGVVDTETTGVDVETDRIVQAAWVEMGPEGPVDTHSWLINPGKEIGQGAIDVHGITNERARAEGVEPAGAVLRVAERIEKFRAERLPVVAFNATFDLTLTDREMRRHHGRGLDLTGIRVIDPMVLDRACDIHRNHVKGGKRRLGELARHYDARQVGAHDALADCLTTARVLWRIAQRYRHLREMDLDQLVAFQTQANLAWAINTELYLSRQGRPDIEIDGSWPYRPLKDTA